MQLNILPPILIVNFKRPKGEKPSNQSDKSEEKADTFVDFPIEGLDLSRFVKDENGGQHLYDLYALSNYRGSINFYTAVCKNHKDGKWYSFADMSWKQISDFKSGNAIVLFYRRRGLSTFTDKVNFNELARKPNPVYL